jgi:hypothetical protein
MGMTLCLLVSLLIIQPASAAAVPEDRMIVPGVRVGKWTLALTLDDLHRMHGYAVRTYVMAGLPPAADAIHDHLVFRWDRVPVTATALIGLKRVEFLQTGFLMPHGNGFRTERGLGFLSTRAQVLRVYGQPTAEMTPQPLETRMIYDPLGIAFSFDAAERMHTMYVFRPWTASRFWHLL